VELSGLLGSKQKYVSASDLKSKIYFTNLNLHC
jgi:hypothetical protein